jgi:hypothetical protein
VKLAVYLCRVRVTYRRELGRAPPSEAAAPRRDPVATETSVSVQWCHVVLTTGLRVRRGKVRAVGTKQDNEL